MKVLLKPSVDNLDFLAWGLVLLFFMTSALLFGGDLAQTFFGASAIIILMLFVSHAITLILEVLTHHPRLGEITGYITNGPELLCVIVGLFHGKLAFAIGVPLGSNFANPVLLAVAALAAGQIGSFFRASPARGTGILVGTMILAASFFAFDKGPWLWVWAGATLLFSLWFYKHRGSEDHFELSTTEALSDVYLLPAILILVGAGYFLDPAVSFTASASHVPEGVISFCILSFITSWPEFRTSLSLMRRNRLQAGVMNIIVSNITNLWLAIAAAATYLLVFGG